MNTTDENPIQTAEDAELWDQIGDAYIREHRQREAQRAWERACELAPGSQAATKIAALLAGEDPLAA